MDEDDKAAEQRRAEAAQWFARLKTLPVSHGTLRDFFAWRQRKSNAEAFVEAERFWNEAGNLGDRPAILRAVAAAEARRPAARRWRPLVLIPAAAVILVAIGIGFVHLWGKQTMLQTGAGESRAVALDDGSRVELNTNTRLKVRYRPDGRQLALQSGEALFRVAHDPARPFIVTAGQITVTATGTQFDVLRLDNRITVTLMQGHVIIRAPDGIAVALAPGQQWRWPHDSQAVHVVNATNVIAWTQGRIVFDNTLLADAIATVNRYATKPVTLDDPSMATQRISGTFEAGDTRSFTAAVTALLPLQQHGDQQGGIHLTSAR